MAVSPSAREIEKEFGVTALIATECANLLADCVARDGDPEVALEDAALILGWADSRVRSLRLAIRHPENWDAIYADEYCGQYLEPKIGEDATIMWLEGKYLACERGRDPSTGQWGLRPREHGFYIANEDDERQSFEEHYEECYLKTERQRLDYWEWIGPRDDDLWTDDFVNFKIYQEYGDHRKSKSAFSLNLSESRICPKCGSPDTRVDRWEVQKGGGFPWFCENCAHEWNAPPAKSQMREDDPEEFYDAHKVAYWRIFHKYQNTEGYYGSIWYIPHTGRRRDEPRLLQPPKGLAWQMAEEWRKEFRIRYGVKKALTKPNPSLTPANVGIEPQEGDLVSDNIHGLLPFGVTISPVASYYSEEQEKHTLGGGGHAVLVLTQREIAAGTAWGTVLQFVAAESRRQQRPVQLWSQPYGWYSPPEAWNLVPTFLGAPSAIRTAGPRWAGGTPARTSTAERSSVVVGPPPTTWVKKGGLSGLSFSKRRKRGRARRRR